jgi:sulfur relay (sulfurtransferase) DsrC/TusE family protein
MSNQNQEVIDSRRMERASRDVLKRFPVILKKDKIGYVDPGSYHRGMDQWEDISGYLKKSYRLTSEEMHYMFIFLRAHYNWIGWFPSVTTLIYAMNLSSTTKR